MKAAQALVDVLDGNRPQTVEEERHHFELAEKILKFEEAHQSENLLKFIAGEIDGEAVNVSA